MLFTVLATAALVATQFPLEELPTQDARPGHCLTFLWTRAAPPLRIAMIDESARILRIRTNGKQHDLTHADPARPNVYSGAGMSITTDLEFGERTNLASSIVEQGALRIEQPGKDSFVVAVGGARSCK